MVVLTKSIEGDICDIAKPLAELWFKNSAGLLIPHMKVFDDIPNDLLKYRIVSKIETDPFRVFYHEVAPHLEELYDKPLQGQYLDTLYTNFISNRAIENYKQAFEARKPNYSKTLFSTLFKKLGYHSLVLPVRHEDLEHCCLSFVIPSDMDIKKYDDWIEIVKNTPWL